jgi:cytochrome c
VNSRTIVALAVSAMTTISLLVWIGSAWAAGDPERGATTFQACAACHSIAPDEHLTGPSLAKIWQRKAGTVEGFSRYSEAMKHVDLAWTEATLDLWLRDPAGLIPDTTMRFLGLRDSKARQDVIAYLKSVSD